MKPSKKNIVRAIDTPANDSLRKYSNPEVAQRKAIKYLGKGATLYKSTRSSKKYMIIHPLTEAVIHFGTMKPAMEDYTKHMNDDRMERYRARATKIKGDWKNDKYSPNNLSINILW
jgi:hypothetical protein